MARGGWRSALDAASANGVVKSPFFVSLGISTGTAAISASGSAPSAAAARYAFSVSSAACVFAFWIIWIMVVVPLSLV